MKLDSVGIGAFAVVAAVAAVEAGAGAASCVADFSGHPDNATAAAIANVHRRIVIAELRAGEGPHRTPRRATARPSRRACV
jgi:hypothetical protein